MNRRGAELCHFGCVHAGKPVCSCRCRGKGHGVPVKRLIHRERYGRRDKQAEYLSTVFTRDSAFPLPRYAGTPIKDLSREALDFYVSGGLKHRQLYSVLAQELLRGEPKGTDGEGR